MTDDWVNDSPAVRCVVGRHKIQKWFTLEIEEGKYICADHAFKIGQWMKKIETTTYNDQSYKHFRKQISDRDDEAQREAAAARMRKTSPDAPGFVYYIRVNGHIKIGYSIDVRRRMAAYGPTAELLAVHPGTPQLEHELHVQFRGELAYGREWFRDTAIVQRHIATVLEQFGEPKKFAHFYRKAA